MASTSSGGGRGRRKQAKPQRKQVDVDATTPDGQNTFTTTLTEIVANASSMSPDINFNEINDTTDAVQSRMNGACKQAAVPEEVLNNNNNDHSLHGLECVPKTSITTEDVPIHFESVNKAIISEQTEEDDKLQEYLQRSDTAVIYPEEPVGHLDNVPTLPNGINKEVEEVSSTPEYFIKCPQCQKGCQSFQSLKEHMEIAHSEMGSIENGSVATPNAAASPTPSMLGPVGPYGCSQCTTSYSSKDQLEKHELLHSPNAQVSCKVCNKTFANVYRLQRHMISHDESAVLRKFKCTQCEKAFKFKHHLKEHIRIHSGEKPFKCRNCGKRFSHSGSYSSHMTSKKCLVMNLKLGRARNSSASALHKNISQNRVLKGLQNNPLNNNISSSPNQNSYLPILPKYSDTAAAFFHSSLTSNPAIHPFYLNPSNLTQPLSPYAMPPLNHILEQLQGASPHRTQYLDTNTDDASLPKLENIKQEPIVHSPSIEQTNTISKSNSSSSGNLVMDTDADNSVCTSVKTENHSNEGDLEAVKRILETVNATVTKQLLQANMHKYSAEQLSSSSPGIDISHNEPTCVACKRSFDCESKLDDHICDRIDLRREGLAAKLEEALNYKSDDIHNSNSSCDDDGDSDRNVDTEIDCESITTTDQVSEDGRKVRVRSLIADKQLKVLKDHYQLNPRPKREELVKIAEKIGFPVRVVQVWFQNTRARDRREGRLIQVPYSPIPLRLPSNMVPSGSQSLIHRVTYPLVPSPLYVSEQPLDLSTKKGHSSANSSPAGSPQRPPSSNIHSDSGEEAVNLSHKSSRSPTPFHSSYQMHYQHSNSSSEPRGTPSPLDVTNTSKLAKILSQPVHSLPLSNMGLVPMDGLMRLPVLTQLISSRISSLSPTSKKRSWNEDSDSIVSQEHLTPDELNKRNKYPHMVLKGLSSPSLGSSEMEIEGQFICDQCDKAFSKQSSLARHKYEHSGQRPHKCDKCPKAFKHKHHLTEHKRLHSGEKPFQCGKCLKRFSHSGSYSQHMNHRYSYCKPYRE